jgi:HAMP domain-containing protein
MHLDSALLSSASVLLGALIGGCASLIAAVYTQRQQNRLQRVAFEITKERLSTQIS